MTPEKEKHRSRWQWTLPVAAVAMSLWRFSRTDYWGALGAATGAIVALLVAARIPNRIRALMLWGAGAIFLILLFGVVLRDWIRLD